MIVGLSSDATDRGVVLIGYSGHAQVVHETFLSMRRSVVGYCDISESDDVLYDLTYLGNEMDEDVLLSLRPYDYFICIGENATRERLQIRLLEHLGAATNAIHARSVLSPTARLGRGVLLGPGSVVNANAAIGDGVIVNSGAVVEHDCELGSFSHLAPNATLTGNVKVGCRSLVGAGTVVIPGKVIGSDVTVGAGSVVIENLESGSRFAGNPARPISSRLRTKRQGDIS